MKFKETIALGIAALVGASTTSPLAWADTSGPYLFVSKVAIEEGHRLRINVAGNFPADSTGSRSCNSSYAVSQHDLSDDLARAQLQVALASFLSRKEVFVVTIGASREVTMTVIY